MTQPGTHHDDDPNAAIQRVRPRVQAPQGTLSGRPLDRGPVWARDFSDLTHEWRRLFAGDQ